MHCGGVFADALPRATTNPIGEPSADHEHAVLVQEYLAPRLHPAPMRAPAAISVSLQSLPPSFVQSKLAHVQSRLFCEWQTMLILDCTQMSFVSPSRPDDRMLLSHPSSEQDFSL